MSAKTPSLFGGAMIIAGTVIGAGMLANPPPPPAYGLQAR
ncbi:TnaB [Neisseria gonorrhoeae]|uniref:TnaB n=1 Tax=Neisseria gonorrhoeae TaxID=485 RepID=A0A378W2A7_NEIGO|nr:TnaB [Neisseria gonorrhoeae]